MWNDNIELYLKNETGNLLKVKFKLKTKNVKSGMGMILKKYLYLCYRDGKKVKDIYIAKID